MAELALARKVVDAVEEECRRDKLFYGIGSGKAKDVLDRHIAEALRDFTATLRAELTQAQEKIERLTKERDEAREEHHYATGVADLAMAHRDTAEASLQAVRAALEEIAGKRFYNGTPVEAQVLQEIASVALSEGQPAGEERG